MSYHQGSSNRQNSQTRAPIPPRRSAYYEAHPRPMDDYYCNRNNYGKRQPRPSNNSPYINKRRRKDHYNHRNNNYHDPSNNQRLKSSHAQSSRESKQPQQFRKKLDRETHQALVSNLKDTLSTQSNGTNTMKKGSSLEANNAPTKSATHSWEYRDQKSGDLHDDSHLRDFKALRADNKILTASDVQDLPRLDPNVPEQMNKILKRRKMISYGKNTVGYDEYLKKIPKNKRKPRCPDHPVTPDATRDIPWKRFHGLVRSWRRALHKYDPEDLLLPALAVPEKTNSTSKENNDKPKSLKESQILTATKQGLQVEFKQLFDNIDLKSDQAQKVSSSNPSMLGELERIETGKQKQKPKFSWYDSDLDGDNSDNGDGNLDVDSDSDDEML